MTCFYVCDGYFTCLGKCAFVHWREKTILQILKWSFAIAILIIVTSPQQQSHVRHPRTKSGRHKPSPSFLLKLSCARGLEVELVVWKMMDPDCQRSDRQSNGRMWPPKQPRVTAAMLWSLIFRGHLYLVLHLASTPMFWRQMWFLFGSLPP